MSLSRPAAVPRRPTLLTESRVHQRRLRAIWRSAGWPCQDTVELELLAAGFLERLRQPSGHETLRVTDAGIALLKATLEKNRAARDAHELLVERVALEMTRAGRIAWRSLSLRAALPAQLTLPGSPVPPNQPGPCGSPIAGQAEEPPAMRWVMAMPDVYSIRHTTLESALAPIVHEVKVSRADLLGDLRKPDKRAAYQQICGEFWYVLRAGIAQPEEIPPECGVLLATDAALDVARPAPRRSVRLPFDTWMALARATPLPGWRNDDAQGWLSDTEQPCTDGTAEPDAGP